MSHAEQVCAGFSPPLSMMHFTPNPPVSWRHTSTRFGVVFRSTTLTIFKIRSVYVSNTSWRSFQYHSQRDGWSLFKMVTSSPLLTAAITYGWMCCHVVNTPTVCEGLP